MRREGSAGNTVIHTENKTLNPKEFDCVLVSCNGTQELLLFLFKSLTEGHDTPTGFCKVAGEADNVMLVFHQRMHSRSGDGDWPPEHLKAPQFLLSAVLHSHRQKNLLFFHAVSCLLALWVTG